MQNDGIARYLSRTPLSGVTDAIVLRVLVALLCLLGARWLVGSGHAAIPCFLGLLVMALLFMRAFRRRRLARANQRLRRRLGGELALEGLIVAPRKRAHFECALVLSALCPLRLSRTLEDGVLCAYEDETVLVTCLARHPLLKATPQDIADIQRAARSHDANRAVAMLTCPHDRACLPQTALEPPVRLIDRETVISFFGAQRPATDEQLRALGTRTRGTIHKKSICQTMIEHDRARRYGMCAAMLLLLYALSGAPLYLITGCALIPFSVICALRRPAPFRLF